MTLLQRVFCYNFKDKILIYSFHIFISKYICLITWEERYFIHLNCYFFTSKSKETKCNGLDFMELWKYRKQVGDTSNVRVSRSVKGLDLLWKYDTNLSCKCRVSSGPRKPWNESSGSWNPWISWYFAQDPKHPEICLSLTFMETLKFAFP